MVVGDDGSLYERVGDERWVELSTPVDAEIRGLSVGDLDVAVGAGGTILQRPSETRTDRDSPDCDPYDGRGEEYDRPTDGATATKTTAREARKHEATIPRRDRRS